MEEDIKESGGRRSWRVILFALAYGAFVAGGLYFGLIFLSRISLLAENVSVPAFTFLPRPSLNLPLPLVSSSEDQPRWEDKERVNVLLLGVDKRADEDLRWTRTDTMMILTLDPRSKTGGMLSIPRDLWVPIPVQKKLTIRDRINTASVYGYIYNYPGGGPALAKKTLQYNLGIRLHYYVLIDFEGFERIIDALGGITVEVERPIVDYAYPTPDYGYMTLRIPAGTIPMDGDLALKYARTRHSDSDFGRMKRQQQVMLAVRHKALQLGVIPKLPELVGRFADAVRTDLGLREAVALAQLAAQVEEKEIIARTIAHPYVASATTPEGASVLVPQRAALASLIEEVFPDTRRQAEAASVEVLNGAAIPGLAARAARFLMERGWTQVSYGNPPDGTSYKQTMIVNYSGKTYSARLLADLLQVPFENIKDKKDPTQTVDIQVLLGPDLKLPPE